MHICTTVTNVAITTIYPGIRTKSGITFFKAEITIFEQINTNIVANPILMPLMAEEVVPKVGHIPNSNTNVGFSVMIPFINIFRLLIVLSSLFICYQLKWHPLVRLRQRMRYTHGSRHRGTHGWRLSLP